MNKVMFYLFMAGPFLGCALAVDVIIRAIKELHEGKKNAMAWISAVLSGFAILLVLWYAYLLLEQAISPKTLG